MVKLKMDSTGEKKIFLIFLKWIRRVQTYCLW